MGHGPSGRGSHGIRSGGELACDWHTVNEAVITYGEALLAADRKRLNKTTAIGLDETSFVKMGDYSHTNYATTVADVENHQIIDILPTRNYTDVAGWIDKQPAPWKERIRFGALDMSATYAAVYTVMLPKAHQVVDPFHVISLANRCLDAVRRRVQNEQTGHSGPQRRSPLSGPTGPLAPGRDTRLRSDAALVVTARAGRSRGRSRHCLSRQRTPTRLLSNERPQPSTSAPRRTAPALPQSGLPPEVQKLGRTLKDWFDRIANFHLARVSNEPTEAPTT